MKKMIVIASMLCLCMMAITGCYGPFRLTKKLYRWNGSFENKWEREAMFLVCSILPVYGFSAFADAVFFNLIEFWGGDNPIAANPAISKSRYIAKGDQQAVMTFSKADRKVRVDLFSRHRPENYLTLESTADGAMIARNADGRIIMKAQTLGDGSISVADEKGTEIACHRPDEMK